MRFGPVVLVLVFSCSAHACATGPLTTVLSCPDVYAALVSRVSCIGSQCNVKLSPAACMQNRLMQRLFAWTADAGMPMLDNGAGALVVNATCTQLADLVALSFLGRAFVETQADDAIFFEFNTGASTLHLRPLGCEFQRPLYSIVLLTALFTLSFILVAQYIDEQAAKNAAAETNKEH